MNKTIILLATLLLTLSASAQRRGRIQNTSDYTALSANKMHKIGSRTTAPLPCIGSPKIPVILVQFSDLKFLPSSVEKFEPHDRYQGIFNGSGIEGERYKDSKNYCSVRDYFIAQSDSLFKPDFSVIGPVTLEKSYKFYGAGEVIDYNISSFYSEACKKAMEEKGFDWKVFDNNGDGTIDFVFFIYAGDGENGSDDVNTIWPKEGATPFTVKVEDTTLRFGGYGCSNETYDKVIDGIGTICHEFSHALGLPDFYDTSYTSFGLDYWDLMDSGSYTYGGYCPVGYSAYERDFMSWKQLVTIPYDSQVSLTILPLNQKDAVAYKIENPKNKNEYFILENRQNKGNDGYLGHFDKEFNKTHGLLIFHVDYDANSWQNNRVNAYASRQRMTIVPADGILTNQPVSSSESEYYNYIKSFYGDIYPGLTKKTEMSSYAVYTGGTINMKIDNINEDENGIITLDLNGGTPAGIQGVAIKSADAKTYDLTGRRVETPSRGIYIKNGKKYLIK